MNVTFFYSSYDSDLEEIEKVFVLMKECMHITRNMSLFEEKAEKVQYYQQKLLEHLDVRLEEALKNNIEREEDVKVIQSSLRIYAVMNKDYVFLNRLIEHKFLPEFLSLKQLKRTQLGPTRYYFESLKSYVEKKTDVLTEILGKRRGSHDTKK
jgi:hypothetical protein